jgi:hypothetical protein
VLNNIPGNESWKLMQVGVVVADINAAIEKFGALGIGPFDIRTLPPDRAWGAPLIFQDDRARPRESRPAVEFRS